MQALDLNIEICWRASQDLYWLTPKPTSFCRRKYIYV